MGLLEGFTTSKDIAAEKNVLGGSAFAPFESGIYPFKVSLAYLHKAVSGAMAVVLHLDTKEGRQLKTTVYIASGDSKGNKNYYERDGVKQYLPGFALMNSLCELTIDKQLAELETEERVVNIWNYEEAKEIGTKVDALTELHGQEVYGAVLLQTVDKNQKGDDGKYHPTGETRDENEVMKFFRASDKLTVPEISLGNTEPEFFEKWEAQWAGKVRDRTSKKTGKAGVPTSAAAPRQNIFDT